MNTHPQKQVISDQSEAGSTRPTGQSNLDGLYLIDAVNTHERFSPMRFLIIIIGSIFLAELIAMASIYPFKNLPYYLQTLIDAAIMIILILPIVYFFSLRPLLQYIEKLRQAAAKIREMALFATLNPDAVLRVQADGRIERSNPAAAELGLLVGIHLIEIIPDLHDLDIPVCIALGATPQTREAQLGKRVLQWTIRGVPELGFAFLYSKDITERRKAEATIRLLSSVVEQTADSVVIANREGVIEYVNPAFERLTGFLKEEALGKTPSILKSGFHDAVFYQGLWDTILRGDSFLNEIANRKKNGDVFYEAKTIAPLRNTNGQITHFVATGKDITEYKHNEDELRKAHAELELRVEKRTQELKLANQELQEEINERLRMETQLTATMLHLEAHIDNSPLAVIEFDPQFYVIRWSREAERIFGWGSAEVVGRAISELRWVHEDDVKVVNEVSGDMLNGKRPRNVSANRNYRKDGTIIHCEWYNSALYDGKGQLTSILSLVLDISARKQAEDALQAANEELTRFNRAMVGRELRMIELKKEVNTLCEQSAKPLRYALDFVKEEL